MIREITSHRGANRGVQQKARSMTRSKRHREKYLANRIVKGNPGKGLGDTFAFASWARLIAIDGKIKATVERDCGAIGNPRKTFRNDSVTRSNRRRNLFAKPKRVRVSRDRCISRPAKRENVTDDCDAIKILCPPPSIS